MTKMFRQTTGKGEAGFTLMETTVALVIMMIGGLGIAAVFSFSIKNNTGARDRAAAIAVAQQEIERLRNLPFNDAALSPSTSTTTVETGGRAYTVVTTILDPPACTGCASLKRLEVRVTPASGSATWALGSVTLISQRAAFTLGPNGNGP